MKKKDYLKLLIQLFEDALDDLNQFSIENDDCFNEELTVIGQMLEKIKRKEIE